jgi:hypothetical protein
LWQFLLQQLEHGFHTAPYLVDPRSDFRRADRLAAEGSRTIGQG